MTVESQAAEISGNLKPRWLDGLSVTILGFAALIVGAMWLALQSTIVDGKDLRVERATRVNANLARAFDEHTGRTLDYLDEVLLSLKRQFEIEGTKFDLAQFYGRLNVNPKIARNVVITDAEGRVILGSHGAPAISLADREHINIHFDGDTGRMFVGKPVEARVNRQWSIVLSRRANAPDGSLLGVVALAVDPFYFSNFYKDIVLGPDRFVGIVGQDGILRSRLADGDPGLGADVGRGELFKYLADSPVGTYIADSILDGKKRIFAYRALQDFPLIVYVATSLDWELAEFNRRIHRYRIAAVVATLVVLIMALGLVFFGVRHQTERRLREQKDRLETAVALRTAELRDKQKALVETNTRLGRQATELEHSNALLVAEREAANKANRAKSDFLSNMSHELRTPLNSIIGFSQLMATDDRIGADHRESAQLIHRSGRHLLDLVNEVLDLAKIEDHRAELTIEPVDCSELVDDSLAMVRAVADLRGVMIATGDLDGVTVRGDRKRLRQVLINFLSNAVKYNKPNGSVFIDAARTADDRIRLRVRDSGPGIDPSRMDELFKPFNRLGAENSGVEGVGIGLALSRRLAELMGGSVGVESRVGEGSLFWIELPRAETAWIDATARTGAVPDRRNKAIAQIKTIVHVEDNPSNIALVEKLLSRLGRVRVLSAHRPALGIDLVKAHKPALVLLDLNMPDMDGYGVLEVLRSDPETKSVPVVAVTAAAMTSDIEKGRRAGFADYVTKPIDVDRFSDLVRRYLGEKAA